MGRKVNPVGFRLKINRDWDARWYAEKESYRQSLQEDFVVRRKLTKELEDAGLSKIEIERQPNQVQVTLFTAKPGIVIGPKGARVKKVRQLLESIVGPSKKVKLEVKEIEKPDMDAKLVAESIASQLQRRIGHSRAMKRAISQALRQGAQGVKIMVSGRLGGSEMSRREYQMEGRVPRNTLRSNIDYARTEAYTSYGQIGIKVWIYKGEVLEEEKPEAKDVYVSQ